MNDRKFLLVPFAGLVALVVATAGAFACTTLSGTASVSPTSAVHDTSVTLTCSATGITNSFAKRATYSCFYLNPSSNADGMNTCMAKTGVPQEVYVAGPKTVNADGSISPTSGTVNVGTAGTAYVCWESVRKTGVPDGSYATYPATFTILAQ